MDGSSSRDGNRGNDKRPAQSFIDKLRERKRGVGIAKLEKMMRVEEGAMKEKCLNDPSSRQHISGDGIAGIQGMALLDGRSSSSSDGNRGNGKRPAQSSIYKPRKRTRGLGIAKLEKMREEEAMKAHISGLAGIGGIQGMISYGTNGNMSGLQILPFARPPSTSEAADNVNPNTSGAAANINPSDTTPRTLQLFPDHTEDELTDSNREGDHNLPVEPACKNSDDPHDLDLDLKL